jgi:phosphopantothenoylcysteine decarboxylase/phosphopantothenate--cysteine ligase
MWENPATQRNLARVRGDGIAVMGPASGSQACGEEGLGRMLEPTELVEEIIAALQPKRLAGRRVLLTAGPTFEPIDPVRGITNSSSGRMGFALARAFRDAGAEVTMVAGPVGLATPRGVARINVVTAADMHKAVFHALPDQHIFVGVAAVADYRPAANAEHKIKKSGAALTLQLEPTTDILAEVAARPNAPFCVGFAAESRDLAPYAQRKRQEKKLPLVVGNLVQDGLGGECNAVTLFDAKGEHPLPPGDKLSVARDIVSYIADMIDPCTA